MDQTNTEASVALSYLWFPRFIPFHYTRPSSVLVLEVSRTPFLKFTRVTALAFMSRRPNRSRAALPRGLPQNAAHCLIELQFFQQVGLGAIGARRESP